MVLMAMVSSEFQSALAYNLLEESSGKIEKEGNEVPEVDDGVTANSGELKNNDLINEYHRVHPKYKASMKGLQHKLNNN